MKILTLGTIDENTTIVLQENDSIIDSIITNTKNRHAELIVLLIENILSKNHIFYDDIDCFSVINGPGSFLGLKVAISTLKAIMCVYRNVKLIANNVFEIISQNKSCDYVVLESGTDGFYVYDKKNSKYFYSQRNDFNISLDKIIITNSNNIVDFLKSYHIMVVYLNNKSIIELNYYKYINSIFSGRGISPLYIREPQINRKNE